VTAAPKTSEFPKTLAFPVEEYRGRLERLQSALAERELDALLTTLPENVTYLSGYQSPGYYKWLSAIVPTSGSPLIVTRGFELTNLAVWSWFDDAVGIDEDEDPIEVTARALAGLGLAAGRIGVEHDSWFLTVADLAALQTHRPEATFVDASGCVERLRVIKSPAEVDYIRRACRVAEAMIEAGFQAVAEGGTENDIAAAVLGAMARLGGELAGLPPFVVSGPRTGIPHATWAGRALEPGDPVMLEVAGVIMRYAGPLLRTAFFKEIRPEHERVAEACLEGLNAALAAIKPGATGADAHRAMDAVFADAGLLDGATHRAGYSVGLNWPPDWGEGDIFDLSPREERRIEPGMTFHVPGPLLFVPPYSIGLSETVVVTETGCECLTEFPRAFPVLGA
jgi:Xaa-Pro aminopeptidase